MPITTSAKKALRQNVRQRRQNIARKDAVKEAVKKYKKLVAAKKLDEAKRFLAAVFKALDKAAKAKAIKKNKASRLKARLAKLVAARS